jgi:NADPH-dependent 2,4-dienoyl-CoA reductase/sulfur reductase-like enzyme
MEERPVTLLGIWLDHSRAEVVEIQGDEVRHSTVESEVGRKHRAMGGTRMPRRGSFTSPGASEHRVERHRGEQIARFYKRLLPAIRAADRVLVVGPGEAKMELAAEVERQKSLQGRIEAVKTQPLLTPNQLIALVKRHFKVPVAARA